MLKRLATLPGIVRIVDCIGSLAAIGSMLILGARAGLRLDTRWDTLSYHIPFAARRTGIHTSYTLPTDYQEMYKGFPPWADIAQGLLWRLTRSVNGTGLVNYIAICVFFYFAWRHLKLNLWVLVILSLTAPLVLIHAACSYIDLFAGAQLAIGVTSLLAMILFDRWRDRPLLYWGLAGLAGASWSKFQTVPVAAIVLTIYLCVYFSRASDPAFRRMAAWVTVAALFAAAPYLKNLALYGNPFWPIQMPVLSRYFPANITLSAERSRQVPAPLIDRSQPELFFRSLFEINHPKSYPHRERWIIDQGNAWIAFRSGGFWVVGVITAALATCFLGFLCGRRLGWTALAAILGMWGALSVMPESHALRYYIFLPLTVAAMTAMFVPIARKTHPGAALAVLLVILGEFAYISHVNKSYYRVERYTYGTLLKQSGVWNYWNRFLVGGTYCMVGFEPDGILFTGPTMTEYNIIDEPVRSLCPPDVMILERRIVRTSGK